MEPKISVIMPVYNTGKYLDESIPSILNQTFSSFELICVDDCSDDETKEKLLKYAKTDSRISVIRMAHNSGAAKARNYGLITAAGTFLQFLDADDIFAQSMLEEMYSAIKEYEADVCVCAHKTFINGKTDDGEIARLKEVKGITDGVFSMKDAGEDGLCWWWDVPWNKLVRREMLVKYQICFQSLKSFNDGYYANMSVLRADKIVYARTKSPLVSYRVGNPKQVSADADIINFYLFMKKLIDSCWRQADIKEKKQILYLLSESGLHWLEISKNVIKNEKLYNLIRHEFLEIADADLISQMSTKAAIHIRHFIDNIFDPSWNG